MTRNTASPSSVDRTRVEQAAHAALDGASHRVHAAVETARDTADGLVDAAGTSARREWRAAGRRARSATVATTNYVRERPWRAIFVAAAIGAAAMVLVGAFGRRRPPPVSGD